MNLNKYLILIKAVEAGSVTRAAQEMGISQSAATQLLASLEKEFQTTLIRRSKSGITLTKDGSVLLPLIKEVAEADARLTEAVDRLRRDKTSIRIATFKSVAVNWLPEIIKEYHRRFPNIRIELVDAGYNDIEALLSEKNVDFGFVPMPVERKYKAVPVYRDRLLAVLPEDFNIPRSSISSQKKKQVPEFCPVSLFAEESVIALSETIDRDAKNIFQANSVIPNICYRVEDDYALLAMVEKGLGISIVPELILKGTDHHVKVMELDPPAFRTIGIAFPSEEPPRSEVTDFYDFTVDYISSL